MEDHISIRIGPANSICARIFLGLQVQMITAWVEEWGGVSKDSSLQSLGL